MGWLILIVVVVVGWYGLKAIVANDERKKLEAYNDRLDNAKEIYKKYLNQCIDGARRRDTPSLEEKKEAKIDLVNGATRLEEYELWNSKITTIMATDTYSVDSKAQLERAWYNYLISQKQFIEYLGHGIGDYFNHHSNIEERRNELVAVFKAFNFDCDAEEKAIRKRVTAHYKLGKG
jgi:hypothetical protein